MTGSSVLHHLPEFAQTHVHWVSHAIQPSCPLSSSSPPAFNFSQDQGLSQWVGFSHQVAKVLELHPHHQFFLGGSVVKNLLANVGDLGLISGSGRSPGERNGNRLQYSCLGNPTDTGAQRATVHEVTKSQTWLSTHTAFWYILLFGVISLRFLQFCNF